MEMLEFINSNFTTPYITTVFAVLFILNIFYKKTLSSALRIGGCYFTVIIMFSGMTELGLNNTLSYVTASLVAIGLAGKSDKEMRDFK